MLIPPCQELWSNGQCAIRLPGFAKPYVHLWTVFPNCAPMHGLTPTAVSGTEAFSAGAACRRIGVLDFEAAILQPLHVIQFAAGDVERALGIHHDPQAACFDED